MRSARMRTRRWIMLMGVSLLTFPALLALLLLTCAQTWQGYALAFATLLATLAVASLPRSLRVTAVAAGLAAARHGARSSGAGKAIGGL